MGVVAAANGDVFIVDDWGRSAFICAPFNAPGDVKVSAPINVSISGDFIYCGTPSGSPPVVRVYRLSTFEFDHEFIVGDPNSLTGVNLSGLSLVNKRTEIIALPHAARPADPASVAKINRVLKKYIPEATRIHTSPMRYFVYDGSNITELPEYFHLKGKSATPTGKGGRLYDNVSFSHDSVLKQVVVPYWVDEVNILHEFMHGLWEYLSPNAQKTWNTFHASKKWQTYYEQFSEEAFAECGRRHLMKLHKDQPFPEIKPFFESLGVGL